MLSRTEQVAKWRRELRTNDKTFIKSHSNMFHVNINHQDADDVQLLNNVIRGYKRGDSRFTSTDTMYESIRTALDEHMEEIYDFVHDETIKSGQKQAFETDMSLYTDDPVGTGFVTESLNKTSPFDNGQKIKAVTSYAVGFAISKDPNQRDGYCLISAYPLTQPITDETKESVHLEDKDLSPLLKKTYAYQHKDTSPVWRIGARSACNDPAFQNLQVYYSSFNHSVTICSPLFPQQGIASVIRQSPNGNLMQHYASYAMKQTPAGYSRVETSNLINPAAAKTAAPGLVELTEQIREETGNIQQIIPDKKSGQYNQAERKQKMKNLKPPRYHETDPDYNYT